MIIIMERDATAENIKAVTDLLNEHGFRVIVIFSNANITLI